jgi:microcystin degradation protein MlrC
MDGIIADGAGICKREITNREQIVMSREQRKTGEQGQGTGLGASVRHRLGVKSKEQGVESREQREIGEQGRGRGLGAGTGRGGYGAGVRHRAWCQTRGVGRVVLETWCQRHSVRDAVSDVGVRRECQTYGVGDVVSDVGWGVAEARSAGCRQGAHCKGGCVSTSV